MYYLTKITLKDTLYIDIFKKIMNINIQHTNDKMSTLKFIVFPNATTHSSVASYKIIRSQFVAFMTTKFVASV